MIPYVRRVIFTFGQAGDMETEWYNRAEAIQQRITQLRDSL
jgi:hypothetical protein